jgi:glycosidase
MNEVARGEKGASDVKAYWEAQDSLYKKEDYRMQFITNHDENSWNGTARERMGDYRKAFAVMSFTVPGMPLIYSGQEADINKRLEFFEKDVIDWSNDTLVDFYRKLVEIKSNQAVLLSGENGSDITFLYSGNERVIVYSRSSELEEIIVMLNFSEEDASISVEDESANGFYESLIDEGSIDAHGILSWNLPAKGYQIFYKTAEEK